MRNNICKFPAPSAPDELSISCFVWESDKTVMQAPLTLQSDRLILIEKGDGAFLFDRIPCSFSTGTLLFAFQGETVSLDHGEGVSYFYIDFDGARGKSLCRRFGIYPHARRKDGFNGLIPFCKDCLLNSRPENVDIAAESMLLCVFSRLSANNSRQNEVLRRIIEYTQDEFQDCTLSLSTLAKRMNYNAKYLSHFFKESMNISYSEYLRSIRLKYAISLFESGISSVKNVALLSGFSDPLYFSNTFKKAVGLSPKDFIAKHAKETE